MSTKKLPVAKSGPRPVGRPRKYPEGDHAFLIKFPKKLFLDLRKLADAAPASINDLVVLGLTEWLRSPPRKTAKFIRDNLRKSEE